MGRIEEIDEETKALRLQVEEIEEQTKPLKERLKALREEKAALVQEQWKNREVEYTPDGLEALMKPGDTIYDFRRKELESLSSMVYPSGFWPKDPNGYGGPHLPGIEVATYGRVPSAWDADVFLALAQAMSRLMEWREWDFVPFGVLGPTYYDGGLMLCIDPTTGRSRVIPSRDVARLGDAERADFATVLGEFDTVHEALAFVCTYKDPGDSECRHW